jgi:aminoglycoside 3-N-acetyltransferase
LNSQNGKKIPNNQVTKETLIQDFQNLGLSNGDTVAITASYGKIGIVLGGPMTVIDSILEVIGSNGTLMMNSDPEISPSPSNLNWNYVFDYKTSPASTGFLPEVLRNRKGALRSRHPATSVIATGKHSEYLTKEHDENSNPYVPYFKLAQINGKYISIGLSDRLLSIRHAAQIAAGLYYQIPTYYATQYRNELGQIEVFTEKIACPLNLSSLVPMIEKKGIIKRGKIGRTNAIIGNAHEIIFETADLLKKNPELNLCENVWCIWCRELEKKFQLYKIIQNSRFYHLPIIRDFLALINQVRLKQYSYIAYSDSWKGLSILRPLYLFVYAIISNMRKR